MELPKPSPPKYTFQNSLKKNPEVETKIFILQLEECLKQFTMNGLSNEIIRKYFAIFSE